MGKRAVKLRAKYLVEDMDRHGNVRLYVRIPGRPKVRIRARPDTAEFWAEYQAAVALAASREPRRNATPGRGDPESFRWLCNRYFASAAFKTLGARTRYVRRGQLERICEKEGEKPYKRLEAEYIRRRRDARAETPAAANAYVKVLRQVFAFAIEEKLADRNPARDVGYLRLSPEGFHTWTVAEVEAFSKRHPVGTKAGLALALLLYTGTRRSDVVRLGRQMERDGELHFTESKGAERQVKSRAIPVLPELRTAIDACPSSNLTYLVTEFDKPFTANGFGNWLKKRCREAGLPHCTAHGLRKAGATIAAENGATEHQLMAMYGWDSPKQAALYTRRANRRKLAAQGMHLIRLAAKDSEQDGNGSVPLPAAGPTQWDDSARKSKNIKGEK
jgi:integrase